MFSTHLAKAGRFLQRLVYDGDVSIEDNRTTDERDTVAGEVMVIEYDPMGDVRAKHRVFIRDLSKQGCGLWGRSKIDIGASIAVVFQGESTPGSGISHMQRPAVVCRCHGQDGTGFAIGVKFSGGPMPISI